MFEKRATAFVISLLTDQEDFRRLPKEFTASAQQWIHGWLLKETPTLEPILVARGETLLKTKIIETKLPELFKNERFVAELTQKLTDYEGFKNTLPNTAVGGQRSTTSISNSKNVVTGNNIQTGGNVHIGDITHQHGPTVNHSGDGDVVMGNKITTSYYGSTPPASTSKSSDGNIKAKLKGLLAKDEIEEAITLLTDYTEANNPKLQNEVFLQSGRYYSLKNKELKGILTTKEVEVESNKIRMALIDLTIKL